VVSDGRIGQLEGNSHAGLGAAAKWREGISRHTIRQAWPGYDSAVVIDFLASPGPFNIPLDIPLTDEMVRNAEVDKYQDVMQRIEHAIQVCGEGHVGIGSDLSIAPIDESDEYWRLHREFVASNEDEEILFMVPKIIGVNFVRLSREVWGG
jgi:microsomal dipeptidase-like Zn-dependent dipeptidase